MSQGGDAIWNITAGIFDTGGPGSYYGKTLLTAAIAG